ncbi:hypothetical protein EDD18DRAFT_1100665 [Armillaria luteobubalina]|uniref:Uncharacterized protein n=1 Tax=Armillaria luteobubalina TaxID=153913 RepID=A0AA39UXQ0_9AGAR|nr:hypothetical protein EDD18DRAFT_1100665 [Armillaria luteobubalina]
MVSGWGEKVDQEPRTSPMLLQFVMAGHQSCDAWWQIGPYIKYEHIHSSTKTDFLQFKSPSIFSQPFTLSACLSLSVAISNSDILEAYIYSSKPQCPGFCTAAIPPIQPLKHNMAGSPLQQIFLLAEDEEDVMKIFMGNYYLACQKGSWVLGAMRRRLWSYWIWKFLLVFIQLCGRNSTKDDEAFCQ